MLSIAQSAEDTAQLHAAHSSMGQTLHYMGQFMPAQTHLELSCSLYDPAAYTSHAVASFRADIPGFCKGVHAYSTHVFVKYKPQGHSEAGGRVEIASAVGEYIPLPNVGDIVDCKNVGGAVGGQTNAYRVLSRYLTYSGDHCSVFLTIADARDEVTGRVRG